LECDPTIQFHRALLRLVAVATIATCMSSKAGPPAVVFRQLSKSGTAVLNAMWLFGVYPVITGSSADNGFSFTSTE
jgi:hypothetical protein